MSITLFTYHVSNKEICASYSWEPGYWQNIIPVVSIDGRIIQTSIIEGNNSGDWIQLRTNNLIFQGQYTIKIEFPQIGSLRTYYLDEIEFWCL